LDIEDVEKILARDDLGIEDEEEAFLGMMKWIAYNFPSRKNHFPKLLECIRLTLLTPQFIEQNIEPLCGKESKELLFEYYKWHAMKRDRSFFRMNRKNTKKTKLEKKITGKKEGMLAIGGLDCVSANEFQGCL